MLTLFSIAKRFEGHVGTIQLNALASWRRALPNSKIILFGCEKGTLEACRMHNLDAGGELPRSPCGRYLVSSAFERSRSQAKSRYLCYLNCDIVIGPDFLSAWRSVDCSRISPFLFSARRRKIAVTEDLTQLDAPGFKRQFHNLKTASRLDSYAAIDMFGFPLEWDFRLPPFAVGEVAWDNWFLRMAVESRVPVIDGSEDLTLLHQEHEPISGGFINPEKMRNLSFAGDIGTLKTLRDSSFLLKSGHITHPSIFRAGLRWFCRTEIAKCLLRARRNHKLSVSYSGHGTIAKCAAAPQRKQTIAS